MRNERDDDRYEGSDDGEYHYSDDTHTDSEAGAETSRAAAESVENYANPDNRSRKIVIASIVVFVILAAVVYKIVAPSSGAAEIAPLPETQTAANTAAPTTASAPQVAQAQPVEQPVAPVQQAAPAQQAVVTPPPASMPAPTQQVAAQPQPATQPGVMPAIPQQMPEVAGQATPPANMQPPAELSPPAAPVVVVQAADGVNAAMQTQPFSPTQIPSPAMNANIDERTQQLAAENAKLASQLQDQYAQQIKTYQEQNKSLEEQVKVLNSRVDTMQTQMNKLLYTLTQTYAGSSTDGAAPSSAAPAASAQAAPVVIASEPPPRVPYNVQAIIPGRAWLRSSNGETLTVAEGDDVKGYGRVTKIDPYDGVVELNINGRTVSLSYGNGG